MRLDLTGCFVCLLAQLAGTQYASSLDVLRLFAYGTLKDYKSKIATCAFAILTLLRPLHSLLCACGFPLVLCLACCVFWVDQYGVWNRKFVSELWMEVIGWVMGLY